MGFVEGTAAVGAYVGQGRLVNLVNLFGAGRLAVGRIQQDYVGSYREAVFVGEGGKIYVRPALVRDIAAFARIWDRNLKAQGFVEAAEAHVAGGRRSQRNSMEPRLDHGG
jgi:hypothetical protein